MTTTVKLVHDQKNSLSGDVRDHVYNFCKYVYINLKILHIQEAFGLPGGLFVKSDHVTIFYCKTSKHSRQLYFKIRTEISN